MAAFTGFSPDLFAFLKGLKANNSKAWFDANRETFESHVRDPLGDLIEDLAAHFQKNMIAFTGDRKKSLFRLNRDTRFSKDKSPYKVNAGAVMTPGGTKHEPGLLYLHLEPAASFVASGFYMPDPPTLNALRAAVAKDPKGFAKVVAGLKKKGLDLEMEYSLKRPPKDFANVTDPATLAYVKLTSFVVSRKLTNEEVLASDVLKRIAKFAVDSQPLVQFGLKALK